MKKFLLIFIFLITLPTSVNTDPLRNILKHTLKGGTKEILRDHKGGELDWIKTVWEKKLTDSNTRKATTIKIKYDSFTKTKTCITRPFIPQFMEVDGFMWREGIGAGNINNKMITIYNGKYDSIQFKFDNKDKIYQLEVMDAQSIDYSLWKKYKKLKTRNTVRKFFIGGREGGDYIKTEAVYLKRLDEYLNTAKKYNC